LTVIRSFRIDLDLAASDEIRILGILEQYAILRMETPNQPNAQLMAGPSTSGAALLSAPEAPRLARHSSGAFEVVDAQGKEEKDYRGRLVLVDESNGEVLGAVGDKQPTHVDSALAEEEDVVVDVSGGTRVKEGGVTEVELDPRKVFVTKIPPGEENYITRGASLIRSVDLVDLTWYDHLDDG
jgi:hypothetical protein